MQSQLTPGLARSLAGLRRQLGDSPGDVDLRLAIARLLDIEAESVCLDCLDSLQAAVWNRLPEPQPQASQKRLGNARLLGETYFSKLGDSGQ